jgi:hypothetical protein
LVIPQGMGGRSPCFAAGITGRGRARGREQRSGCDAALWRRSLAERRIAINLEESGSKLRWHCRRAAIFLEARHAADHHGANDQQRPGCGLWDRRQRCQGQGGAARTVVGSRQKVETQGILAVPDEWRKEIRPYFCEGARTGGGSDSRAPIDDAVAESDGGKPVEVVEDRKENGLGIARLRPAIACNIERIGEARRRDRAQQCHGAGGGSKHHRGRRDRRQYTQSHRLIRFLGRSSASLKQVSSEPEHLWIFPTEPPMFGAQI